MNSPIYQNDVVQRQIHSATIAAMLPIDMSRILIIYTGGTIGMKNSINSGYIPEPGFLSEKLKSNPRFNLDDGELEEKTDLVNRVHKSLPQGTRNPHIVINQVPCEKLNLPALVTPYSLYHKRIRYSILEYSPLLDSSNMTMTDWIQIATDIELNYELFDAFIVLHGTDTMAYTASALSFLLENLGKTVIITGSQVPISEVRTDAIDNLLGALTIAGHFTIPEVGLFFDNKLFRGNRCSKVNADEFNAFDSPNLPPICHVGINIDVVWEKIFRPNRIAKFNSHKFMNPNVATLRLFPGITTETVKAFFSPTIAGVILETYGAGNAPSNRQDILQIIKEACDRGVVVVNCSQCKKATVSAVYETGVALFKIGVVPGADMTPECALTKLAYLLGKGLKPSRVRALIGQNLRGELSVIDRKQKFAHFPSTKQLSSSKNVLIATVLSMLGVAKSPASPKEPIIIATSDTMASLSFNDDAVPGEEGIGGDEVEDLTTGLEQLLIPMSFCHSVRVQDVDSLRFLLNEYGPMINVANEDGQSTLHVAVKEGSLECVKMLLENGANLHQRDRYGRSILLEAIKSSNPGVADILLVAGAHFCAEEQKDVSYLLTQAVMLNDLEKVKLFIRAGANPNIPYVDGRTPLHLAVCDNRIEIVNAFLEMNDETFLYSTANVVDYLSADEDVGKIVPSPSKSVPTSATTASSPKKKPHPIVMPFLRYRLDLSPIDRWNRTPLQDAETLGLSDMVGVLKKAILADNDADYDERFIALASKFASSFNGEQPTFYAKSPGRVNLIGEHIDYSGYSVLPMAIGRDTIMAVRVVRDASPAFVELVNMNEEKYPRRKFLHEKEGHVTIDSAVHEWSNYFKCGYKGVLDELNPEQVVSLQIVVDGIVPTGSGLSSSSAFVCCAALATLHGNGLVLNKGQLTQTAIKSEQYAGVQIGGMDQSISIMAPKGSALLIDFYPTLNATPITLPVSSPAPMFVIANTTVTADKHVTAPKNYNLRVVECRFAAAIMAKKLGLTIKSALPTLKQVHEAYIQSLGKTDLTKSFQVMVDAVEKIFPKEPLSLEQVAAMLESTVEKISATFIGNIKIIADGFKLYQRSLHVFQEASRVYEFREACLGDSSKFLKSAGDLMNKSHASCRELFECSCPELDEITQLARNLGAFGSRLTGAGWGGCSVSLVAGDKAEAFIEQLKEQYYFKHHPEWRGNDSALQTLEGFLFASPAEIGASVFEE